MWQESRFETGTGKMISNPEQFRHEFKYFCTGAQCAILRNNLRGLLDLDSHVNTNGTGFDSYNIRSLYFDDPDDCCYLENVNGTDPREKFRIRIYNGDSGKITLENKRKRNGMTQKLSCRLTEEQCRILMTGIPLPASPDYPQLLQKLLLQMETRLLRPVVIVDYDRIPYIYPRGNVRVTFDMNIASSGDIDGFLQKNIKKRPIMAVNQYILEVKWDDYLPDFIYHSLQLGNLQRSSYSKFHLCRLYRLY